MSRDRLTLDRRSFVAGTGTALGASAVGGAASAASGAETAADGGEKAAAGAEDGESANPRIVAHRGFAGAYPENTLGAFERATRRGAADMVELDVVPTADGTVVVFHDSKLSSRDGGTRGLTDVDGYVWEHPWEEVSEAEVLQSGETVPSLERAFEVIPASVGVNVELKNPGTTDVYFAEELSEETLETQMEVWRPMVESALSTATAAENEVLVSSFHEAALAVTRDVAPGVPVAFLFWDSIREGLRITRKYDCEALHPPYNMVKGSPFFNDAYYLEDPGFEEIDLVERAHEEGREVNTWTVGTWYQAERLADAGVDGVIADYPNLPWDAPDAGSGDRPNGSSSGDSRDEQDGE
jgi:glycerophosphoryl diester phosphodiesterase